MKNALAHSSERDVISLSAMKWKEVENEKNEVKRRAVEAVPECGKKSYWDEQCKFYHLKCKDQIKRLIGAEKTSSRALNSRY